MVECSNCSTLSAKIDRLEATVEMLVKLYGNLGNVYSQDFLLNRTLNTTAALAAEQTAAYSPVAPVCAATDCESSGDLFRLVALKPLANSTTANNEIDDNCDNYSNHSECPKTNKKQPDIESVSESSDDSSEIEVECLSESAHSVSEPIITPVIEHAIPKSHIIPYYYFSDNPLRTFDAECLDTETSFTHMLNNRKVAYFGPVEYKYGNIVHPPKALDYSNNAYLIEIIKSVEAIAPFLDFNSVMVQSYRGSDSCVPLHSDDEDAISPESHILTISLGEERNMYFKCGKCVNIPCRLVHGSIISMSAGSQKIYKHEIPNNQGNGLRVSITFRQLNNPNSDVPTSSVSSRPTATVDNGSNMYHIDGSVENFLAGLDNHMSYSQITETGPRNITADIDSACNQLNVSSQASNTETRKMDNTISGSTDVVYISSSMFKRLKHDKLSSSKQRAHVFSYSGKNAAKMRHCLMEDDKFLSISQSNVSRVYLLCGTNNVEDIYYDRQSLEDSKKELSCIMAYLQARFPNADINILNLLPRKIKGQTHIVSELNAHIKNETLAYTRFHFVDTAQFYLFSNDRGERREMFFYDKVHLNDTGVRRLANHLKFLSHNKLNISRE